MDFLTLDYETYYAQDYSLTNMSTEAYIRDPRFETNIVGLKHNDGKGFWLLPDHFQRFVAETDWSNTAVIHHHAHFDAAHLAWHYGVRPAFIIDTLSMARIIDGPKAKNGLEHLAQRHGFGAKGDALRWAKGKRLADFTRDELYLYGQYCVNDCELTYQLAMKFLPLIPESRLRLIDLKIRMFTEPVFEGNVPLLADAVKAEAERKQSLLSQCGYDKTEFSSNDKFAKILRDFGVEPPTKRSTTTGETIYAFAKTDPGMQELLEHEDEDIRFLAETRLAVKSTIIETRAQRFHDCAVRGPMPVYIKPHGVHTHRGSAGDKMNWQNMTSVNKKRPEMTVLKRSINAPEGCSIVACDSSQIQARLTAWLAGETPLVEAFRQGRDVYSEFASVVYGRPVDRKRNPEDFIAGQAGKISILGFGFGMGWFKAAQEFMKGALGGPPIQFTEKDMTAMGIDPSRFLNNPKRVQEVERMPSRLNLTDRLIHCAVSDALVLRYRGTYPQIPKLWNTMEQVINAMIRGEEMRFGPNGFLWTSKDRIHLPSGLTLHYRDITRNEQGEATYWNGRNREHVYGGSLTNNVIQGLEQEFMGDALIQIADLGYKVATETYDEIVCVVPDEYAGQCLVDMQRVMKTPPSWAPDLPVSSEGGIAKVYAECK